MAFTNALETKLLPNLFTYAIVKLELHVIHTNMNGMESTFFLFLAFEVRDALRRLEEPAFMLPCNNTLRELIKSGTTTSARLTLLPLLPYF